MSEPHRATKPVDISTVRSISNARHCFGQNQEVTLPETKKTPQNRSYQKEHVIFQPLILIFPIPCSFPRGHSLPPSCCKEIKRSCASSNCHHANATRATGPITTVARARSRMVRKKGARRRAARIGYKGIPRITWIFVFFTWVFPGEFGTFWHVAIFSNYLKWNLCTCFYAAKLQWKKNSLTSWLSQLAPKTKPFWVLNREWQASLPQPSAASRHFIFDKGWRKMSIDGYHLWLQTVGGDPGKPGKQ